MKFFERLSDDDDWDIDSQLSGYKGGVNSPELTGEIPANGWPKDFNQAVVERILSYLDEYEEIA